MWGIRHLYTFWSVDVSVMKSLTSWNDSTISRQVTPYGDRLRHDSPCRNTSLVYHSLNSLNPSERCNMKMRHPADVPAACHRACNVHVCAKDVVQTLLQLSPCRLRTTRSSSNKPLSSNRFSVIIVWKNFAPLLIRPLSRRLLCRHVIGKKWAVIPSDHHLSLLSQLKVTVRERPHNKRSTELRRYLAAHLGLVYFDDSTLM